MADHAVADLTTDWDQSSMARLWKLADPQTQWMLQHLCCHAGERVSELTLLGYAAPTPMALEQLIDQLERTCVEQLGRPLPFERIEGGMLRMSSQLARLVYPVF